MRRNHSYLWVLCLPLVNICRILGVEPAPVDPASSHPIPPFTVPAAKPGVDYERFMILGDFGTTVPDPKTADEKEFAADQKLVASAMASRAKTDGLDFMITVGDNFYEDGVKSVDDPMFKSAFVDIYAGPLQVPVYPALGDHDHRGNVQAQIDYSQKNKNWKLPAAYYTFTRTLGDGTKVQFFAVDTIPIREKKPDVSVQIAWLDQELGKSDARWKFVFGHDPLYSHTEKDRAGQRTIIRGAIEALLIKYRVDAHFAGHDHILEMLKPVSGVNYVISGGGAGAKKAAGVEWTDESYYAATVGGFVQVRISNNEAVFEFVRPDGKTQYAHVLAK